MALVLIDSGHGGQDPGGVANGLVEKTINLVISMSCSDELKRHGVDIIEETIKDDDVSLDRICEIANKRNVDLVCSFHNNIGEGDGFEVFHSRVGGVGKELAKNIEDEVLKLGQNSRGVKTRLLANGLDYYKIIRETNAPAVICEGAFLDNKIDVLCIDTLEEQKAFGVAYAKGILKTLGIEYKEKSTKNGWYKVQVGAFRNRANAEKLSKKLKDEGYVAIIVEG